MSTRCSSPGPTLPRDAAAPPKDADDGSFVCDLTQATFRNPAVVASGHTYEHEAITAWLSTSAAGICPRSNRPLAHRMVAPNWRLRDAMGERGLTLDPPFCAHTVDPGADAPQARMHPRRALADAGRGVLLNLLHASITTMASIGMGDLAMARRLPWANICHTVVPLAAMVGIMLPAIQAVNFYEADFAMWRVVRRRVTGAGVALLCVHFVCALNEVAATDWRYQAACGVGATIGCLDGFDYV